MPYLEDIQNFAKSKNGKFLSIEYINTSNKLLWQCSEGHQWEAQWNSIKDMNSWCPECSVFKTEKECKRLLKEKLNIKFTKTRFYFYDQRLEFDGYNAEHKIAFEYHGEQHYKFPNHWHKNVEDFALAQERDNLKEQYAAENDIKLIIIPYTKSNNLKEYINGNHCTW